MEYEIGVEVTCAQGYQTYRVEADSPEEAIALFEEHGGTFVDEEIEVMDFEVLGVEKKE